MFLYTNEKDIVQILNTLVILKVEFETSEKHMNSEANIQILLYLRVNYFDFKYTHF